MNDKPTPPTPKPERIFPVKALYLAAARTLPDGRVSDVIVGGEAQGNKARFVIEYIPSLQHHRVAYYGPSATTPTKVMMYAREWCSWEPVQ
jgi:hypothetical protein